PIAALGLYEMSRRRERGLDVMASDAFEVIHSPSIGAILRLAVLLGLIFFAWVYAAQMLYTQIFASDPPANFGALLDQVLNTERGQQLFFAGNLVGFAFAVLVLAISVVSFPLLLDRNVGAATAIRTSVRATLENPLQIAAWGLIVAVALLL